MTGSSARLAKLKDLVLSCCATPAPSPGVALYRRQIRRKYIRGSLNELTEHKMDSSMLDDLQQHQKSS